MSTECLKRGRRARELRGHAYFSVINLNLNGRAWPPAPALGSGHRACPRAREAPPDSAARRGRRAGFSHQRDGVKG